MNNKTKKSAKIAIISCLAFIFVAMIVIASVGIYARRDKGQPSPASVSPISWSIDEWDGESESADQWYTGSEFGNRGSNVFTIDSAESFVYFINLVNDPAKAAEYNYFSGYTIYLNRSIDLQGYNIESIGKPLSARAGSFSTFQGTFDGSYNTIYNANIQGSGLFGYVQDATIKNIGLYNCVINSTEEYTGGIVGYAMNSQLSNTYVRLGSVNGAKYVGGLVGQMLSTNGMYGVEYSFADTSLSGEIVGGIIGFGNANHSSLNNVDVGNCYYTGEYNVYGETDSDFVSSGNVIKANNISQFSDWDYSSEYDLDNRWCDYSCIEGASELDFNYPILSAFNKVFLTGSYYESTIFNESTGLTENYITLADAFTSASNIGSATINIIARAIYVDTTAVAMRTSQISLSSEVDTTIYRGASNPEILIIGAQDSTLILGGEDSQHITFDGNRDYIEANGLTSGTLIYAQGQDFKMYDNVTLRNNINNTSEHSYGGAIYLYGLKAGNKKDGYVTIDGGLIENCSAGAGGGIAIVGTNANILDLTINNCSGSGAYFSDTIEANNSYEQNLASIYVGATLNLDEDRTYSFYSIATYTNNTGATKIYGDEQATFGGGVLLWVNNIPTSLNLNGGLIANNYAYYGGGVASVNLIDEQDSESEDQDYSVKLTIKKTNSADAGISMVSTSSSVVYDNQFVRDNSAYSGGGVYSAVTTINDGASDYISSTNSAVTADATIYAVGPSSYVISFWYYNKGNSTYSNVRTPMKVPTPTSSPSGYSFVGYSTSSTGTSATISSTGTVVGSSSGAKNYYAVYRKSKTVTAYFYSGLFSGADTYMSGSAYTYCNYNASTTRTQGYSMRYFTVSRGSYDFAGWTTSATSTDPSWRGGTYSISSTTDFYAVYGSETTTRTQYSVPDIFYRGKGVVNHVYPDKVTTTLKYFSVNLNYSRTISTTSEIEPIPYQTECYPPDSDLTLAGWGTSPNTTTVTWSGGSWSDPASNNWWALWIGSETSEETGSATTYGSTITLSFYTGSGSSVSSVSAYRQRRTTTTTTTRYRYCFNRSSKVIISSSESDDYEYRLYDGSSYSSWSTSIPSLEGTASYRSSSLSGYEFAGWTTSSTSRSPSWTYGSETFTSSDTFYAVWLSSSESYDYGSPSTYSSISVNFETGSGSSVSTSSSIIERRIVNLMLDYYYHNYNLAYSTFIDSYPNSTDYQYRKNSGSWSYSIPSNSLTVSYKTSSLAGYTFQGWTTSSSGTTPSWTNGSKTFSSSDTYYAVWNGDYETTTNNTSSTTTYGSTITATFNTGSGSSVSSKSAYRQTYYTYDRGYFNQNHSYNFSYHSGALTNQTNTTYYRLYNNGSSTSWSTSLPSLRLTVSYPTSSLSGYSFQGWSTSSSGTSASWTSGSKNLTSSDSFYAVWNGDYVTSTNNDSSVSAYGSTITASFSTGSGSSVSSKSAYRETYYNYDTGYYNQNHSYNFSYHSGNISNVTNATYYRLNNNGSISSWSTTVPSIALTVPYSTSSLSGYTFCGWTTSSTGTSASWTGSSKSLASSEDYYAVWRNSSGTRNAVSTLTHSFETGVSSTDFTDTTTKTTPYTGVTKYFSYNMAKSRTLTSGGTAGTPSYSSMSYPTATRSGYTFMGWDTNNTTNTADWTSGSKSPTSATTYYAVWKSNIVNSRVVTGSPATGTGSYTVSFDGNGNTGGSTSSKTGTISYTYNRTQNYKLQYNYNLSSAKEVDSSYGSNYVASTSYGTVTLPSNGYTKTGYHFDGWAQGSATGTTYAEGASYRGNGNTTFYATWEIDTFTVSIQVSGSGSVNHTSIANVPYGSAIMVDGNSLTIADTTVTATAGSGYRFTGWTNTSGTITANRTITANFELSDFVVTLNKQGGSGGDSTVTATYGQAMPTITPPTRPGYKFGGYYTGINGSGTKYYNADGSSATTYNLTSEITLYAQWTAIDYAIAFNKNFTVTGAISSANWGSMANISTSYGQDVKLTANQFKRNGYSFLGWATTNNATSATYANGATVNNLTTIDGETVTLYAVWRVDSHTVTYDTNGGANINSASGNFGSTISLPTPTKAGYSFAGWVETADLLGDGSTFVRVFYHDNQGGSQLFASADEARSTNSQYKYSILNDLQNFISDGKYTFLLQYEYATGYNYWSQTSNPLDDYKSTSTPTTATGYSAIDIDWSSNYWGGLTRQNSDVNNTASTLLSGSVGHSNWFYAIGSYATQQVGIPSASDISVQGTTGSTSYGVSLWVKVDDLSQLLSSDLSQLLGGSTYYIRNTDTTLTALWKANSYNISYYDQGGEPFSGTHESGYPTIHTYGTTTTLKSATKPGYDFAGWYIDMNCTGSSISSIGATSYARNINLYAKWTAKTYTITTGIDENTKNVSTSSTTGMFNSPLTINWSAKDSSAQYEYALYRVRVFSGNNTNGTLLATYVTGTSATFTMTGTYYSSIYIYVEHTAMIRTYTITIQSSNVNYGTIDVDQIEDIEYGESIAIAISGDNGTLKIGDTTVNAIAKVGYHIDRWSGVSNNAIVTGNMTIIAEFEPNDDTPYQVKHYQQNLDNEEYTLVDTEYETGTTGAEVTPAVKSYAGFTYPDAKTITIAPDGSSVVEYYYDRFTYTLTLNSGTGIVSVSGAGQFKYGKEVSINATLQAGYDWAGWTGDRTISTQNATIEITGNLNLTANGKLKTFDVTINTTEGGQVDKASVNVTYGTSISATANVLTIGSYIITATANSGYEFDTFIGIPESATITENIIITAQFAKLINITINVDGNTNLGESFGIDVNGEKFNTSTSIRSGSPIKIEGRTKAENLEDNEYQIVSVYRDNVLIVGPTTGTINNTTGTNLGVVTENTTIQFVFEKGYKIAVSVTDEEDTSGIDIDAEKSTLDGIIAESSDVTITISPDTIIGGETGREYLGIVYTVNGEQFSTASDGNDDFKPVSTGDGNFVYELNKVVDEMEVIVKTTMEITADMSEYNLIIHLISEDGFIRIVNQTGTYRIYSGTWRIESQQMLYETILQTIFKGMPIQRNGNYFYFTI